MKEIVNIMMETVNRGQLDSLHVKTINKVCNLNMVS